MAVLWHPDTCDCQFDVATDWSSAKTLKACPHHATAADPWIAVRNENAWKNMVVNYLQELYPDGNILWQWTADQKLGVSIDGVDSKSIQSVLDKHFGPGDVVVI